MTVGHETGRGAGARPLLRRVAARIEIAIRYVLRPALRPAPWPSLQMLAIAAVAFVVLFLAMALLMDVAAITAARKLPGLIIAVFQEITDFGKSAWFLYPLGALMVAIALSPPDLPRFAQLALTAIMVRAGFLFIAIGLPSLFSSIIKRVIGRARPFVGGTADAFLYHPFVWTPAYASMPSGHATTAFAAAVAVGALWPRARTAMWIYAALIALSRVVITAHHPSDVFAGAVVGGLGAILVRNYFASRRLGFAVTANGDVVAFPGPSWRRIKAVARALLSE